MLKRTRRFVVIEAKNETQSLIEKLLRLRIIGRNRVMKIPQPRYQGHRLGLRRGVMVLGNGRPEQKHCSENVRLNLHLRYPPEFEIVGGKGESRTHAFFQVAQLNSN